MDDKQRCRKPLLHSIGGRKFVIAVLVLVFAFIGSFFIKDKSIQQKWMDMAQIVVGVYIGYKAAEAKDSNQR